MTLQSRTNVFRPWRLYCLIILLTLAGCRLLAPGSADSGENHPQINNSSVSVDFAPDGRLWRLLPGREYVYVDYSDDQGATFSKPVRVNSRAQDIDVWPENPPAIVVGKSGRIHVLYYADEEQKATTYFSFSDDQGQSFSEPVLVSDHARTDKHYMNKMLVDDDGRVYLFWHDMRHEQHNEKLGPGVLSLYFTFTDTPGTGQFINRKVSDGICSCCRTATDFSPDKLPVILARVVLEGGIRDHALIRMQKDGSWSAPQRVTHDDWRVDACPEHGPALSIDERGRNHLAWFTLGDRRQGIFYGYTDDDGVTLSRPMPLGNPQRLPSHPDVLAVGGHVVLAWKEYDGSESTIWVQESFDRGKTFQQERLMLSSTTKSGHPSLASYNEKVYLSWAARDLGHRFVEVK